MLGFGFVRLKATVGFQLTPNREKHREVTSRVQHKLLIYSNLEARVGIGRVSPSTSHSKSIVYGIADYLTINGL
jgi:hypothetical protein